MKMHLRVVICGNGETLGFSNDRGGGLTRKDCEAAVTSAAVKAAEAMDLPDGWSMYINIDSRFAGWNGKTPGEWRGRFVGVSIQAVGEDMDGDEDDQWITKPFARPWEDSIAQAVADNVDSAIELEINELRREIAEAEAQAEAESEGL